MALALYVSCPHCAGRAEASARAFTVATGAVYCWAYCGSCKKNFQVTVQFTLRPFHTRSLDEPLLIQALPELVQESKKAHQQRCEERLWSELQTGINFLYEIAKAVKREFPKQYTAVESIRQNILNARAELKPETEKEKCKYSSLVAPEPK